MFKNIVRTIVCYLLFLLNGCLPRIHRSNYVWSFQYKKVSSITTKQFLNEAVAQEIKWIRFFYTDRFPKSFRYWISHKWFNSVSFVIFIKHNQNLCRSSFKDLRHLKNQSDASIESFLLSMVSAVNTFHRTYSIHFRQLIAHSNNTIQQPHKRAYLASNPLRSSACYKRI